MFDKYLVRIPPGSLVIINELSTCVHANFEVVIIKSGPRGGAVV
jgi:hypothetical protein